MTVQCHALNLTAQDERLVLSGITLNKIFRSPGSEVPRHYHAHTNVVLCVSGDYQETIVGDWRDVSPASILCRPAGETHITRYGLKPTRCLIFEVLPEALSRLRAMTVLLDEPSISKIDMGGVLAMRISRELRTRDCLTPLVVESLFYELITHVSREQNRRTTTWPIWLDHVKEFLHSSFQSSIRLSDVASSAQVHPSHLCNAFRRHFHMTVGEYVRNLRILYALRLMKSEMPLADIAVAAGFCDQSHFSRAFKRHSGTTPARYRVTERPTKNSIK